MNKLLICALLATLGISGSAQESFFAKDKVWIYETYKSFPDGLQPVTVKASIIGDTIIDGKTGHVCCREYVNYNAPEIYYPVREENGVISKAFNDKWSPLIDFNTRGGDILDCYKASGEIYPSLKIKVFDEKTMSIEEMERRVLTVNWSTASDTPPMYHWIEGIGTVDEGFYLTIFPRTGYALTLIEVWQGDKLIFSREKWLETNGVEPVKAEVDAEGPVYDLQGREVKHPQPGRVYIQGSRKFRM